MKILFIPEPKKEETSERTPQIVKILKKKHELLFLSPQEHWIQKRGSWMMRALERLRNNRRLVRKGKNISGVDLVFCRDLAFALPGRKIAKALGAPCVWDSEGSIKAFWDDHHKYPGQILPWLPVEKWLTKRIDQMITVTKRDETAYLKQGLDPDRIHIIPVCVDSGNFSRKTKAEARQSLALPPNETLFLFFSNFNYLPNKKGLKFLNEKVAPLLPGKLLLCGTGNLPKKLHPKIRHIGFLPLKELYDLIRAADVCLSPIWEANGTLTKVLDMLGHGAPTVITPAAHKGIPEIQDGIHAMVAQNEESFIQKTLELAKNKNLQEKLGEPAQELIRTKYDWKIYENKLLNLLEGFVQ